MGYISKPSPGANGEFSYVKLVGFKMVGQTDTSGVFRKTLQQLYLYCRYREAPSSWWSRMQECWAQTFYHSMKWHGKYCSHFIHPRGTVLCFPPPIDHFSLSSLLFQLKLVWRCPSCTGWFSWAFSQHALLSNSGEIRCCLYSPIISMFTWCGVSVSRREVTEVYHQAQAGVAWFLHCFK